MHRRIKRGTTPFSRAVFDGLHVTELRSQYSISRNREGKARRTELLITNY